MSAWNAIVIRSNISFVCSTKSSGMPRGVTGTSRFSLVCFSESSMRRSISRTVSRYSATRFRSPEPSPPCRRRTWSVTASRMLRWVSMRRRRLVGGGAVSEHPIEHDARIDLHRHRRRRRAPGNRVHVGAAEPDVARSDQAAVVLDRPVRATAAACPGRSSPRQSDRWSRRHECRRRRCAWDGRRSGTPPGSACDRRRCRPGPAGRPSHAPGC